jgi:hypothetical protein
MEEGEKKDTRILATGRPGACATAERRKVKRCLRRGASSGRSSAISAEGSFFHHVFCRTDHHRKLGAVYLRERKILRATGRQIMNPGKERLSGQGWLKSCNLKFIAPFRDDTT